MGEDGEERRIGPGQAEHHPVALHLDRGVDPVVVHQGLFLRGKVLDRLATICVDAQGVLNQFPEDRETCERLDKHPLGPAVAVLEHPPLEGILYVRRGEGSALVERDAVADLEPVFGAVCGDLPLGGQHRLEIIYRQGVSQILLVRVDDSVRPPDQILVDSEDDRPAGRVIRIGGVQSVRRPIDGIDNCIRVLDLVLSQTDNHQKPNRQC